MPAAATDPTPLLILKTGSTYSATRRRFGDFDRWFLSSLRGSAARFRVHDVTGAPPPPLEPFAGVIVTGSPAAVYDEPSWLPALERTLRDAVDRQRPSLLCVCFGAQALARSLGGSVEPCPAGWEIGTVRVKLTPAGAKDRLLGRDGDGELLVQATHQDWIVAAPEGTELLAGNAMSPVQAFRAGERAWATQFHPEASAAVLEDLVRARRADLEGGGSPMSYPGRLAGLRTTPAGPELLARFVELSAGDAPGRA